ncbi:MAG: hypothetical protein ABJH06_14300 [Paraglaciecola sp.]|uniref:hypothetical protein n=1 Tax=Paraglaciecola sp. TaxID=1920173 RepID=UPI0032978DF0
MDKENNDVKQEPSMQQFLSKMPLNIVDSFSDKQLLYLKVALGSRKWIKHKVDVRGTFFIPFFSNRIYYVFLMGRNYRELSRNEKAISSLSLLIFTTMLVFVSIVLGLLALYLVKSALGINLFQNFSLGIWDWFKELWY